MSDPKRIGPYKIVRPLGAGGMGVVYLAHPKRGTHQQVAIKVLPPNYQDNDEAKRRFISEIESLRVLQHPNIVPLVDFNTEGDMVWFAMPYFPRGTLKDALRQGKHFTPREICRLLGQVADAIDYAHDQKYLHRDIKPENILLDEYGTAVLTDFGIAKHEDDENLTNTGVALGTEKYMSRARKAGAPATRQTDVYALGVIIYQLLSGDIRLVQIEETWLYKSIPAPLMEVVAKAAAEREEDSFESAGEFALAFEKAIGEPCGGVEATFTSGPITAPLPQETSSAITPRIARAVVEAISRSVQLNTPISLTAHKPQAMVSIVLALCSVVVFGVIAVMLRPNFGFLSQPTAINTQSGETTSPSLVTQVAQVFTVLPSVTSTPLPTQPIMIVPTITLPTILPTATSIPPTFTPTWTLTPSVVPPTTTPLPSLTSTPTMLPATNTPTPLPSPTPAYYVQKTILLVMPEGAIPFDMISLPSTEPCTPISSAYPEGCIGKNLWIDLVPVTVSQYRLCINRGECPRSTNDSFTGSALGLSWLNVADFCAWRGGRLPTDVEINLLVEHPSEGKISPLLPEWLGVDKQGSLIAAKSSLKQAAVWDGMHPALLAQMEDEAIEINRDFAFRCIVYQP